MKPWQKVKRMEKIGCDALRLISMALVEVKTSFQRIRRID